MERNSNSNYTFPTVPLHFVVDGGVGVAPPPPPASSSANESSPSSSNNSKQQLTRAQAVANGVTDCGAFKRVWAERYLCYNLGREIICLLCFCR